MRWLKFSPFFSPSIKSRFSRKRKSTTCFQRLVLQRYCYSIIHIIVLIHSTFIGPEAEKVLHLYHHHEHFDVITKMPAFFGRSYSCATCNKGYNTKEDHRCKKTTCLGCHSEKPCAFEKWVKCENCNR